MEPYVVPCFALHAVGLIGTLCDWPPSLSRDSEYTPVTNISLVLSDTPVKEIPGMKKKPKYVAIIHTM